MAVRKKYISLGDNPLSIDIVVQGQLQTFDFRGGIRQPIVVMPSLVTDDPKEQNLLENHAGFNVLFKLESEQKVGEEKKPEPLAIIEQIEAQEKEFNNAQEAKEWLNSEHSVPFNQITTKEKVIAKALELGFNVTFKSDNK